MPISTAYNPYSHYYQAHTLTDRLAYLRQNGGPRQAHGATFRRSSHFNDSFVSRMDMIDVLGGYDAAADQTTIGHTGCVNALAWSSSGDHLASGSDDRRVILWKMGGSDEAPSVEFPIEAAPQLGLAQAEVIETGHRANIFSVKWAPNSGDRRLFTCAGDAQIRVFDLTRASSYFERSTGSGKEYKVWPQDQGACTRVLRCHTSRAKRISTENSPDVFLSCAEDGDIRQTDLRVPHTCARSRGYGQGCPRPLVQFQMELYSLSVSKLEPWLFSVAGTSDKVFLMDRRMVPRLLQREWGCTVPSETAALTHCVRLFEREPTDEDGINHDQQTSAQSAAALVRRRRKARAHVTAVKISEHNGRDLLASYSGDDLYKFDIQRPPGLRNAAKVSNTLAMDTGKNKRRKTLSRSTSPVATTTMTATDNEQLVAARRRVLGYLFIHSPPQRALFSRRERLHDDLENLQQAADDDDAKLCVALCRLLLYVSDANGNAEQGRRDVDIQRSIVEARHALSVFQAHLTVQDALSLLDEYCEADAWGAEREIVRTRGALFAHCEKFVRQRWPWPKVTGGNKQLTGTKQDADAQPHPEEMSNETEGAASLPDSDGATDESENAAWPGNSVTRDDMLLALERLAEEEDEDDDEDIDVDDDDESDDNNEDGGEDDDTEEDDDEGDEDEEDSDDNDVLRHDLSGGGDAPHVYPARSFAGHVNVETVKDCGFVGSNDEYVWSGSDCGHLFMWRNDARGTLCGVWKGDDSVVNVLAQHPTLPVCAVSGIDDTVKVFGPRQPGGTDLRYSQFDKRDEIMQRNAARADVSELSISSRSLMRLFARRMTHGDNGSDVERMTVDGEEQDCVIA